MNANLYLNSQHAQLSGRYLNNKVSQQTDAVDSVKRVASNRSLKDKGQNVISISSTTIKCNCEKPPKSNGSDSETNEEIKIKFSSETSTSCVDDPGNGSFQLKCAVSPKLSLHKSGFQQAIIISDESEVRKSPRTAPHNTKQLGSSADNQFYRQLTHKISKSEQTSPNNVEIDKANFLYETNNRSTGCLVYPSDPWIKNANIKGNISPKAEKHLNLHHNIDPWIRRHTEDATVEVATRLPKKNIYREKSLSSINNKLLSTRTDPRSKSIKPQLKHSNTAIDDPTDDDHVFLKEPGLLFAPFSPQHRNNASHKAWSLDQSKSASYIPDKVKEISSPLPNHVRKSVYQNNNSNLLCPNDLALHSRHSSLSIPTQSKEELPLNIRRLSEQIREPPLERENLSLSLSDRNVSKMPASESAGEREPQKTKTPNRFHANRDAAVQSVESHHNKDFISLKRVPKDSTSVNNVKPFTPTYKPDPLLETTC